MTSSNDPNASPEMYGPDNDPDRTPNNAGFDLGDPAYPSNDDCNLAMIAHLSGCAGIVAGGLLGFIGPLIIYITQKDNSQFVANEAKEALNFQITLFLLSIICVLLAAVSCGALLPVVVLPVILQLVFGIIAALAVRNGTTYEYPFNIRLIK